MKEFLTIGFESIPIQLVTPNSWKTQEIQLIEDKAVFLYHFDGIQRNYTYVSDEFSTEITENLNEHEFQTFFKNCYVAIQKPFFHANDLKKKGVIKIYESILLLKTVEILKELEYNFIPRSIMSNDKLNEIYLHGFEYSLGETIWIFDETCSKIKNIINNYSIKDFHLNYSNVLELHDIRYTVFRDSNSNIAILQEMYEKRCEILVFDLISYKVIGSMKISHTLKMFCKNNLIFYQKNEIGPKSFLFYKIVLKKNQLLSNIDPKYICNFNEYLRPAHLFKDPFLLPCGNSTCFECIQSNMNSYRGTFKCNFENCKEEHHLNLNSLKINKDLLNSINNNNRNFFQILRGCGKKFLNNLGICFLD